MYEITIYNSGGRDKKTLSLTITDYDHQYTPELKVTSSMCRELILDVRCNYRYRKGGSIFIF